MVQIFPDEPVVAGGQLEMRARRVMKSLARLRQDDVQMEALEDMARGVSDSDLVEACQWLQARLKRERAHRAVKVRDDIRQGCRRLSSSLRKVDAAKARASVAAEVAGSVLAARVADLAAHTRTLAGRLGTQPRAPRLHETRVAVKCWRYAVELSRDILGHEVRGSRLSQLTRLQDLGGRSQDMLDLLALVDQRRRHLSGRGGPKARRRRRGLARLAALARARRERTAQQFMVRLRVLLTGVGHRRLGAIPAAGGDRIHGALPSRATSPRPRRPSDQTRSCRLQRQRHRH
jgi:CHAD domain-containing protein